MAIQVRRGNEADFDASKMLPGEWAVSLDTRYVRMCFAPGLVLRMSTYESFEADMAQIQEILLECRTIQSAVQRIQAEVNAKASLTIEYSNSANQSADRAYSEAERAKTYADNAEAVTGVQIATKDRAGLIKGGDNHIAEDGTLMLITSTDQTTMPNSNAGRLKIDSIEGGESQQNSTSGKNLLDCSGLTTETKNGVTFTPVYADNGELEYINVNGTATALVNYTVASTTYIANQEYVLSGCPSGGGGSTYKIKATNDSKYADYGNGVTFSYTEDTSSSVIIVVYSGTTISNIKFYPMLRDSSIGDDTYEPYTGGIPSPNPSYPQEIKKTVVSEIKTHGKNMFDASSFFVGEINSTIQYKQLNLKPNTVYAMSSNIPKTFGGTDYNAAYIIFSGGTDTSGNTTANSGVWDGQSRSVLSDGNGYVSIGYRTDIHINNNLLQYWYQLEEGTVATEYEPYAESVITLSQPIELYGMGDVQDVIEDGKILRRFGTRMYDGDENWKTSNSLARRYYIEGTGATRKSNALCSCAKFLYLGSSIVVNECMFSTSVSGRLMVNTDFETAEEWKAYLVENPMTLVYEREVPIVEDLPLADQISLNSLSTYDGITYLKFDSEIEPTFKGEYGTSKVGGYTLEGMLAGRNGELYGKDYNSRLSALEASVVNNI